MYNLILDARKFSVDLRIEQNRLKTNGHEMYATIRNSTNMIDRLTAAMMLAEATIESLTKSLNLSKEDTDKILGIINSADGKMVDSYIKGHLVGVPAGNEEVIVPDECYKEFGSDLDGCSRQENQGCKGCRCLIKK